MPSLLRRWLVSPGIGLSWLPWVLSGYHTHVLTTGLYYVILAIGWNLLAGYTGQFSLAHHTFAGLGLHLGSARAVRQVPLLVGIAAGVILAAGIGYGLGTLCLRMGHLSGPGHLGLCRVDPPPHHRGVPDHAGDLGSAPTLRTPRPTPYYYLFSLALVAIWVAWELVPLSLEPICALSDDGVPPPWALTPSNGSVLPSLSRPSLLQWLGVPGPLCWPAVAHTDEVQRNGHDHHYGDGWRA